MNAPLPWLLLALVLTATSLWQLDQKSLPETQALSTRHLLQVTLGNQPHCPQLTWHEDRWLTIRHGDGRLENRPGRNTWHFKAQLKKQLRNYPQCPGQHWVIYGRFTPQTRSFILQ